MPRKRARQGRMQCLRTGAPADIKRNKLSCQEVLIHRMIKFLPSQPHSFLPPSYSVLDFIPATSHPILKPSISSFTTTMGKLDEKDGIAILQLVIFPFIFVAAVLIWSRTGWRVGSKIWRYPVSFSLLRIAGSISTLISIDHSSSGVTRASNVCELIGIAPLLLTYIGILRQM